VLTSALGCGIGSEFNLEKLRYHKVILMTDADVDGAHIQTLLLTFFYRHMTELVQRGYVYLAQPPFYKVKRGRTERYIQDDEELAEFLLTLGLEGLKVFPEGHETALSDEELRSLVAEIQRIEATAAALERRGVDARLVEAAALGAGMTSADLSLSEGDRDAIERRFVGYLESGYPEALPVEVAWERDQEHSIWQPTVKSYQNGAVRAVVLDQDLLESPDYERLLSFAERTGHSGRTPFRVESDSDSTPDQVIPTARQLLAHVLALGRKGLHIQRYKGLGEMNAEQLWETTMDASVRTLLRVQIEDAVVADETFSVLMGDAVEPRKEFIEKNALNVENLDI
jgi:DNA gyrase subunit B